MQRCRRNSDPESRFRALRLPLSIVVLAALYVVPVNAQWVHVARPMGDFPRRLPPTNQLPQSFGSGMLFTEQRQLFGPQPTGAFVQSPSHWTGYQPAQHSQFAPPPAAVGNHSVAKMTSFGGYVPAQQHSGPLPGFSLFFASGEDEEDKEEPKEDGKSKNADQSNSSDPSSQRSADPNKPLGEEPADTTRSFLRSATVLLEPGHMQFDFGLEYSHFETRDLVGANGNIALVRARRRQWFIPLAVRYGLTDKSQLFTNIPIGASLLEATTSGGGDTTSVFGMGDVQAGFLHVLKEQDDCGPDIIFGSSFTAPTGADAFHPGAVAYLGSGFWNVETHVTMIKSLDPAVIIGALGYAHYFQADHLGQTIRLGERITYDFGAGFAINDTVTFSTILQGSFQFPSEVDGSPLPNSSIEPISLRVALTDYVSKDKIIEPFARFGLTEDAAQAELGVITTYSY